MKAWILGLGLVAVTWALLERSGVWTRERVPDAREWVVVDEAGHPIEGATISLLPGLDVSTDEPALRTTTTNAMGRFELDLDGGECVHAWKPGYVGADRQLVDWVHPVTLTLKPAGVLVGRVVSAERGAPIAGAKVVPLFAFSPRWQLEAITAADGSFRIDGLTPDHDYRFSVQAPESFATMCEFEIQRTGEVETTFSIPTEPVLRGRVIDLETRAPIGGATLVTESHETDNRRVETTTSAADGTFAIHGVPEEGWDFSVVARKSGFVSTSREFGPPVIRASGPPVVFSTYLRQPFSAAKDYEMGLVRGGVIEGTVTGASRGWVVAIPNEPYGVNPPELPFPMPTGLRLGDHRDLRSVVSNGRFRIDAVPTGCESLFLLLRRDDGDFFVSWNGPLVERFGDTCRVDLPFEPAARIYGTTTVGGVAAEFRIGWKRGEFSGSDRDPDANRVGRYELRCPVSGELTLVVWAGGGYPVEEFPIHVVAGRTQRRDLELRADLSRIRGVAYRSPDGTSEALWSVDLQDRSQLPRFEAGVRITATRPRDGAQVEGVTNADGSFELRLPDASWDEWNVALDKTRFDTWLGEGIRSGATVGDLVGVDLDL